MSDIGSKLLIEYEPMTIKELRDGSMSVHRFVSIEGRIAAFKVNRTPYPYEQDSSMSEEKWALLHGSGLAVGFLYQEDAVGVGHENKFLYFSCRTRVSDLLGETSDLAMILEASKTTKELVRLEGEIQTNNPPRMYLHHIYLTDGFKYTTHNAPRADR